jgi:hypothetical protein
MKYPWYQKMVTWWFGLTVLYVIALFTIPDGSIFAKPLDVLGLFVPYGLWNPLYTYGAFVHIELLPLAALAITICCLATADRIAGKLNIHSPAVKVVFNLCLLLVLTVIVDYSIWGQWFSMRLLLGYGP